MERHGCTDRAEVQRGARMRDGRSNVLGELGNQRSLAIEPRNDHARAMVELLR